MTANLQAVRNGTGMMERGLQPLDDVLNSRGWDNHDVVRQIPVGHTHKMVQKGRAGRRLTRKTQFRILEAVRKLAGDERAFSLEDLFNYRGS